VTETSITMTKVSSSFVSSGSPDKYQNSISHYVITTSFHILCNSLFINHRNIQRKRCRTV